MWLSRLLVVLIVLALSSAAEAQQPTRTPRVAYLTGTPLSAMTDRTEAFRQGLRELGHVEGKNIVIEWRSPEGKRDRMPTLAAELVRLKIDVIVTAGGEAHVPPRKQRLQFQLSWRRMRILLATGLSPVWRDLVEILLGCPSFLRSYVENDWRF